jgi:hypothetical protein
MDMILICPYFKKNDFVTSRYFEAGCFQCDINLFIKDNPAILCRTDQMVQKDGDIVAFMDVLAHASQYTETEGTLQSSEVSTWRE